MIVAVDPSDPTPVYEQIRTQIAYMIAAGTVETGTRLPTIRQLAADLGLAKGTVARAYEALLHDGLVESAGRRGTRVISDAHRDPDVRETQLRDAARLYAVRARQLGIDSAAAVDALTDAIEELA